MHEVSIVVEPERRVIGLEHRGPYEEFGPTFEALTERVGAAGLQPEMIEFMGVYFDDPREVPAAELRSMAAIRVREELAPPDGFVEVRLPSGRYARVEVKGPYDRLAAAYMWIFGEWLPASGERDRDAPSFEVYANTPEGVAPEELLTLIYVPLA